MSCLIDIVDMLHNHCPLTLVIAAGGVTHTFTQRGVAAIHHTYLFDRQFLAGASVADKVIGKAAAAFMIEGGVSQVYADVISRGALELFLSSPVDLSYGEVVDFIANRTLTGRCPIDSLCHDLDSTSQIIQSVNKFFSK